MDAREKLRQFLEQRRESGVRELVLDAMTVDEVMRLLGAADRSAEPGPGDAQAGPGDVPGKRRRATPAPTPPAGGTTPADDTAQASDRGDEPATPAGDWRAALRAAGIDPHRQAPSPVTRGESARIDAPEPRPTEPVTTSRAHDGSGERVTSDPEATAPAFTPPPRDKPAPATPNRAEIPLEQIPAGIVVGEGGRELFGGPGAEFASIDEIAAAVASCTRCPLHRTATNPVPGEGNPQAGLVCVGEAPGATEDATGRPFVGQAGQLLDKILAAINLSRDDVFICNVLKHRPPQNRNPLPDEVRACSPYLIRQIELIRPRVIVAFGTFAAQTLLNTKEPIGKLRGSIHRYYGVPLVVTYHPAALLRNPAWKRPAWDDVKLARRLLDRAIGT